MDEKDKGEEKDEPKIDAFGQDLNPSKPEPEKKPQEQGEDIEKHPLVKELRTQLEAVKKEFGGNLSGAGKKIKELEKQIEHLNKGGSKQEATDEPRFKEIKRSKDLTQEQKDEMTDAEIKQMDMIADLQESINEMNKAVKGKKQEAEAEEGDYVADVKDAVKSAAKELAKATSGKPNTELANQIIESFNSLGFKMENMTEEDVNKRVAIAASQLPNYKPPKEQGGALGGAVKGTDGKTDPFGIDKIVEEAVGGKNDGSYPL